ncbi:MAG TPA: SpoIIE family protein phosphatase [Spirochaetota bacterium]|nr:SpoIIE family protein phosphatase [Spirochaetota bacterium]HOS38338.1 SpoIIE family protein phosphatase [Spirochaetota bacterium]HPU89039.1 SpoIIE family protein phosphatase [Spirochaetota bacterium]
MSDTRHPQRTIAIVDDDDAVNQVLTRILQREYAVRNFLCAEDMIAENAAASVDAVITDVDLPGISGIEFLSKLCADDPNLPVIVITGYNDIDIAISALKSGAFDFILKPFNNDQIILSVRRAIERRRLLMENAMLIETLTAKNAELEELNARIRARNVEIENELDIASNLQRCLFPASLPAIPGLEMALQYHPVEKVSGDFFEFDHTDDRRFSLLLADVSGHGLPAALYSAMIKAGTDTINTRSALPSEFMRAMNTFLIRTQKKMSYSFATLFFGRFDLADNTITYTNGGIPAPILIKRGGEVMALDPNASFIGIFDSSRYRDDVVPFEPGDTLLLYTDGAFEIQNPEHDILGHNTFIEIVLSHRDRPITEIVDNTFNDIRSFFPNGSIIDDITILGMRRTG